MIISENIVWLWTKLRLRSYFSSTETYEIVTSINPQTKIDYNFTGHNQFPGKSTDQAYLLMRASRVHTITVQMNHW